MGYTDNKTSDRTCGTCAGTDGTCGSICGTCGSTCGTCGSAGGAYAGRNYRVVGAPFIKKDARALVTGKPVFTDDLALKDCLVVKVLRSPYAHAMVKEIDCGVAAKIPGIECILTWKDVPQSRFTMAGQTYPEPSPYDRLILDRRLRFAGDAVAIVAGRDEAVVDHAMRLIRVKYEVLEPVLDMHDAKDAKILVHPEEDWKSLCDVGADNRRNLCASGIESHGDLEQAFAGCTHVIERVYHTKANQQAMMETFRAYTHLDVYGRLNVVASTQIPFHTRRILAHALDIPKSRIRVIKPRIGGGFGAKQTVVAEVYPAIVTWKTGKPAKIIYSRYESQIASSPRHEMEVRVKLGCDDTKANQQAMMETFRAYTHLDVYGRLNVVASTQIPFHTRRILAHALDIPKSRIRVIKPRIGGGFGAKQTVVAEVYPAIVTWKTGKPAKIIYSRYESQIASSPRHEMEVRVKLGCDDNGILKAMDVYTLSNTGAYGEHGPTTVGLSGHKSIPLYHTPEAFRFSYDVVYTNRMSAGAYRGYGATQGIFAVESAVSELAAELGMDPVKFRELNMVKEGDVMPAYYGETADSCALDRCVARVKDMIGWDGKYPRRQVSGSKVRGVGLAMAMQGSSISGVDVAGATIKINDDGFYNLIIGAADMGTGCDTTLAQVAAECLGCELDDIVVFGADTDISPYDSGSYASSTAYLTGTAVVKTCEALKEKILHKAAKYLETGAEELEFDGKRVYKLACEADGTRKEITIKDLANRVQCANEDALQVTQSHSSPISPPPFMAGAAEVEVDLETGQVELIKFAAAVDCGTPLNENLARVQTEGGLVQGIGMALYEDVSYSKDGKVHENSFMQYKVPSRLDVGRVQVEFESSFEPTGPFGAKSIGEVVINTPSPAIANAVYNAVGVRIRELPITAEKVFKGMNGLD